MNKLVKITALFIVQYMLAKQANATPRLYKELFPEKKQRGMKLEYMKGAGGKTLKLAAHALDSNTQKLAISGIISQTESMFLFKNYKAINENGVIGGIDYGLSNDQKETLLTTAKWSDATNSTPIADITRWQDAVEGISGERPSRAVCSRKTWNYLLSNSRIKSEISAAQRIISDSVLRQYIQDKTGVTVLVYSAKYTNASGVATAIFPDEIFTLLPAGNIGYTVYGTSPAEADLIADPKADIVMTGDVSGIALSVTTTTRPINKEIEAQAIMLPSGEGLDKIFIATVHS